MTLTALPPQKETPTSSPLYDMVVGSQLTNTPETNGIDADELQAVVDGYLSRREAKVLASLVRSSPPEALAGLCRNLLDRSLDAKTVAHNTMILFDSMCLSYYYSARPANYKKIHQIIGDTEVDLTKASGPEFKRMRVEAISRLGIHRSSQEDLTQAV